MKKILLPLITTLTILYFSCNKPISNNNIQMNGIQSAIVNWMNAQKINSSAGGVFIDSLKNLAIWKQAITGTINGQENVVYVPFIYNTHKNGLVFIINRTNYLVEKGYFVDITPQESSLFEYNLHPENIMLDFIPTEKTIFRETLEPLI